jgi:hypothetical protein
LAYWLTFLLGFWGSVVLMRLARRDGEDALLPALLLGVIALLSLGTGVVLCGIGVLAVIQ